jgi:hypothetical protein
LLDSTDPAVSGDNAAVASTIKRAVCFFIVVPYLVDF